MLAQIFKAYDIRGIYPDEIDEVTVYRIARAYARWLRPKKIAVGKDVRISSPRLWQAAALGLQAEQVEVIDIGTVSTDMMYFAVAYYGYDGGLAITASHNPREYNGLKLVRAQAIPISGDSGIREIRELAQQITAKPPAVLEPVQFQAITADYVRHCLSFIDKKKIKQFKLVANANFGPAGQILDQLKSAGKLPVEIIPLNYQPDGTFPKGRPDPLILENRHETESLIRSARADLGVAWDADADRCFFFDEQGNFIDGYYIVALLSAIILRGTRGEKVIIDPRLVFATRQAIKANHGIPLVNKVGHTFIKERMRKENAIFAGENSAHLYFRDNYYCDNGMIPLLLILAELSASRRKLSELVAPWREKVFVSGEINFTIKDPLAASAELRKVFADGQADETDGLSVEYSDRRFNVRSSNTEPLLRLNVEAYASDQLRQLTEQVTAIIKKYQ